MSELHLVDDTALASQGFLPFVEGPTGVTASGTYVVIPERSLVKGTRGPTQRARLDAWIASASSRRLAVELDAKSQQEARAAIVKICKRLATTELRPTIVTQDRAWAAELRRSFQQFGFARLEGTSLAEWFALEPIDDASTPERQPPEPGLRISGRTLGMRLGKLVQQGGEGWIHEVVVGSAPNEPAPFVCKVLKRPSDARRRKLERLASIPAVPGVAWPDSLVHDPDGAWLGFLMRRVAGHTLDRVLRACHHGEPPTRAALASIARQSIERIAAVHAAGALVGDIQPKNLLVSESREVTLIDADSVQIEGFPCPVGVVDFLHPELLGHDLRTRLRSSVHEAFAVAVLVFEILLCGFHPYAHKGGGSPLENQRTRNFPYSLEGSQRTVPGGPRGVATRLWSHLSPELRQAFVATFAELSPPDLSAWSALLVHYEKDVDRGLYSPDAVPALSHKRWRAQSNSS